MATLLILKWNPISVGVALGMYEEGSKCSNLQSKHLQTIPLPSTLAKDGKECNKSIKIIIKCFFMLVSQYLLQPNYYVFFIINYFCINQFVELNFSLIKKF